MRFARHLAAALLLAAPGLVPAQEVSFSTLARGSVGPFGPPARRVVRSALELRQFGLARLVAPAALDAIAWEREMVLAALLGTCPSGGHAIEVQSAREEAGRLVVVVRSERPAPGAFVPAVRSAPYHLVLVPRCAEVEFRAAPAAPGTEPEPQAPAQEHTGRVEQRGASEVRLLVGGRRLRVVPPSMAEQLERFGGHLARVRGVVGAGREGEEVLEMQELVSPQPRELEGEARRGAQGPELVVGGARVRAWGPAAGALALAEGRAARCRAWVFAGADGTPVEARIEAVEATAQESTSLLGRREWRETGERPWVREGTVLQVLDTSPGYEDDDELDDPSRVYARVRTPQGEEGWIPSGLLAVGAAPLVPFPGPSRAASAATGKPAATPGVTGVLGR